MDWQHLIMNGENLAEYAALLAAEGLLGHQHANSGWGTFDDDNMVGATAFMETLELAVELRRAELRRERRAARLRPLPVHRGRGRRGEAQRAVVALHRLASPPRSTTPRCGRPRPQGRSARPRARVRGARGVTGTFRLGATSRCGGWASGDRIVDGAAEQAGAVLRAPSSSGSIDDTADVYGVAFEQRIGRRSILSGAGHRHEVGLSPTAPAGGRGRAAGSTCGGAVEASTAGCGSTGPTPRRAPSPTRGCRSRSRRCARRPARRGGRSATSACPTVTLDELRCAQAVVDVAWRAERVQRAEA